ncbi:hypothetical protein [Variovorax sp. RA8]|uniref:hypothetical protein n=1 Tax=Variovorax sp. (strain JCM 16519 / RA8) TaxID=662548 RepID=UPI000AD1EA3B|nr:hypothetical protein [Variovorax sp. RA8]VTU34178.1 hypothetical protein RA8CHR_04921 [Variovorax sp. RA8]
MAKTPKTDTQPTTDNKPAGEDIAAAVLEAAQGSQTHTYEDGTFVVGCPPWPEKSPKQRAAEAAAKAVQGE